MLVRGEEGSVAKMFSLFAAPPQWSPLHHISQGRLQLRTCAMPSLPRRALRVGSASLLHVRCLNRLLIDPWEVNEDGPGKLAVILPADDGRVKVSFVQKEAWSRLSWYHHSVCVEKDQRARERLVRRVAVLTTPFLKQHVKKILKSEDGKTLRIGVVDGGVEEDAVVEWQSDGALKLQVPGPACGHLHLYLKMCLSLSGPVPAKRDRGGRVRLC